MQKYWDSQAAPVCVMQKTHGEEPSSWFISVIFQCMKKGLRPNGYFPLTRQPLLASVIFDQNRCLCFIIIIYARFSQNLFKIAAACARVVLPEGISLPLLP